MKNRRTSRNKDRREAGQWRIGIQDLEDYIADAYRRTAERIASGELADELLGRANRGAGRLRAETAPSWPTPLQAPYVSVRSSAVTASQRFWASLAGSMPEGPADLVPGATPSALALWPRIHRAGLRVSMRLPPRSADTVAATGPGRPAGCHTSRNGRLQVLPVTDGPVVPDPCS
jgi:hypothetical protein